MYLDDQVIHNLLLPMNINVLLMLKQQYEHLHKQFELFLHFKATQLILVLVNKDILQHRLVNPSLIVIQADRMHLLPTSRHFLLCLLQQYGHLRLLFNKFPYYSIALFQEDMVKRDSLLYL